MSRETRTVVVEVSVPTGTNAAGLVLNAIASDARIRVESCELLNQVDALRWWARSNLQDKK